MSWIFRTDGCRLCMDLPEANSTTVPWFVLSVSSLPLSVMVRSCHACVNLSRLRSSGFTPMLYSGSSPSPMRQQAGHIACTELPEDVRSSWNIQMRSFKIFGIWPQTDIHTHNFHRCSHARVGLVRLTPVNFSITNVRKYTHKIRPISAMFSSNKISHAV